MSLFICAHGELYSKCKFCLIFDEALETSEEDEYMEDEQELLTLILKTKEKEKIEY